jgi:hypothetical protein
MMKSLLLSGAAVLALCACGIAQAGPAVNALGVHGAPHAFVHHARPRGAKMLYDQNSATGTEGFFSQALSSTPQYDEYLADDFTVPKGHIWKVTRVDVTGFYYRGSGPASSVNLLFWPTGSNGEPNGKKGLVNCQDIAAGNLGTGAFEITLPKTCKAKFKGGKEGTQYWLTVQANMKGPKTSGEWAWTADNTIHGSMAAGWWYGAFETFPPQCGTSFQSFEECTGYAYDLAFDLMGRDSK